MGEEGWWSLA